MIEAPGNRRLLDRVGRFLNLCFMDELYMVEQLMKELGHRFRVRDTKSKWTRGESPAAAEWRIQERHHRLGKIKPILDKLGESAFDPICDFILTNPGNRHSLGFYNGGKGALKSRAGWAILEIVPKLFGSGPLIRLSELIDQIEPDLYENPTLIANLEEAIEKLRENG